MISNEKHLRRKDNFKSGPVVLKKFMLNSAEHEFLTAYKYQNSRNEKRDNKQCLLDTPLRVTVKYE